MHLPSTRECHRETLFGRVSLSINQKSRFWTIQFRTFTVVLPVNKSITSQEYKTFLLELRAARKRKKLTQADLAVRLGETQSFVSKCERGERRLDIVEVRAFCRAIGVTFVDFVHSLDRTLEESALPPRRHGKNRPT